MEDNAVNYIIASIKAKLQQSEYWTPKTKG